MDTNTEPETPTVAPTETTTAPIEAPNTGDSSNTTLMLIIMSLACGSVILLQNKKKVYSK